MIHQEIIPHLFRTEYRKIVSVLCKFLGTGNLETAEDLAGETFQKALEIWPYRGIPENPQAWLYKTAKNLTINQLNRRKTFEEKILRAYETQQASIYSEPFLSEQNIKDSQLQMLFVICNPLIPSESQVALALRILCGFGLAEIADAFCSNKEAIHKKLQRAREKLRSAQIKIEMPNASQIDVRLANVLATLYLLFSEGYYSESQEKIIRKDLCEEAIRLATMLIENSLTDKPEVSALLALMLLQSSRFAARINDKGLPVLFDDQDTSLWNQELITKGAYFLHRAAKGNKISRYHLEAGIAFWYTQYGNEKTKWYEILKLYDRLLAITPSPQVALNRIYVLSKVEGQEKALVELELLQTKKDQYFHTLKAELLWKIDRDSALNNLEKAIEKTRTNTEKAILKNRLLAWQKENLGLSISELN